MEKQALINQWLHEQEIAHIKGWDFSHIRGRYKEEDDLPWNFENIIKFYFTPIICKRCPFTTDTLRNTLLSYDKFHRFSLYFLTLPYRLTQSPSLSFRILLYNARRKGRHHQNKQKMIRLMSYKLN